MTRLVMAPVRTSSPTYDAYAKVKKAYVPFHI